MQAVSGDAGRGGRIPFGRLLWVGPLAGVAAALVNALVYVVASAFGAIPEGVEVPGRGGVTLSPVVFSSFVPALVAALVLAIIGRFTSRPVRNFRVLAVVVLLLSFATPFTVPGAPAPMVAVLLLMHVLAATIITGILTTLARDG